MVLGLNRVRMQPDTNAISVVRPSFARNSASTDWLRLRGAMLFEASCDIIGGFPGYAESGAEMQGAHFGVSESFLLVDEGRHRGFGMPIRSIHGTALCVRPGREDYDLRIFYREDDTTRSFTVRFRMNRLALRGGKRSERAQDALEAAGMVNRLAEAPAEPNLALRWEDAAVCEDENVIWRGPISAPIAVGQELVPCEAWLSTKSLIWGSGRGEGLCRLPLSICRDLLSTRVRDQQGTPIVYLGIDDTSGRFEVPIRFDQEPTPDRNFRERGAFLVNLRARGIADASPLLPRQPWRMSGNYSSQDSDEFENFPDDVSNEVIQDDGAALVAMPELDVDAITADSTPPLEHSLRPSRPRGIGFRLHRLQLFAAADAGGTAVAEPSEGLTAAHVSIEAALDSPELPEYATWPESKPVDDIVAASEAVIEVKDALPVGESIPSDTVIAEYSVAEPDETPLDTNASDVAVSESWVERAISVFDHIHVAHAAETSYLETSVSTDSTGIDEVVVTAGAEPAQESDGFDVVLSSTPVGVEPLESTVEAGDQTDSGSVGEMLLPSESAMVSESEPIEAQSAAGTESADVIDPSTLVVTHVLIEPEPWTHTRHFEAVAIGAIGESVRAIDRWNQTKIVPKLVEPLPASRDLERAFAELDSNGVSGLLSPAQVESRKERLSALSEASIRLRTLLELREAGHLTDSELETRKTRILNRLSLALTNDRG